MVRRRLLWWGVAGVLIAASLACSKFTGKKEGDTSTPPPPPVLPSSGEVSVGGNYAGTGTNEDGSSYSCDVVITREGDRYKAVWYFNGKPGYEGVGIKKGQTFVVGFANNQGYGVVAYTVNGDGSLDGLWAAKGAAKTCSERLTPKK